MSQTITRNRSFSTLSVTPRKMQPFQHEVVEQTNHVLTMYEKSRCSVKWLILNAILALCCYMEWLQGISRTLLGTDYTILKITEISLLALFCWNTLTNLYIYLLPSLHKFSVGLDETQKTLLGIHKEQEKLFDTSLTSWPSGGSSGNVNATPISTYPIRRTSSRTTPNEYSPSRISPSRGQYSPSRGQYSPSRGQYSPGRNITPQNTYMGQVTMSTATSSPLNVFKAGPSSCRRTSSSPNMYNNSTKRNTNACSPKRYSDKRNTSASEDLMDVEALVKYVEKEEKADQNARRANRNSNWSYNRSAYDYMPSFGTYQLATKSPTTSSKDSDDDDSMENAYKLNEVWRQFGVDGRDFDTWTENLRKWLAQSVLEPLVKEINSVNERLAASGSPEFQIGATSQSNLQMFSATKTQQLPSLISIIPYLEVSNNQEYLVDRLKELSTGGCFRLFRWNGGGSFHNKPWNSDLPTDSQILLHLFCTYMDTHLPANPRLPHGKSFTGCYFLKTPAKPTDKKSEFCLYQSRIQPPHFKFLAKDSTIDLPKGRNNLFHVILMFLYHVQRHNYGMLGRVNLGMSGINILWVLQKK